MYDADLKMKYRDFLSFRKNWRREYARSGEGFSYSAGITFESYLQQLDKKEGDNMLKRFGN